MNLKLANEINYEELNAYEPATGVGATDSVYVAAEPGLYKMEVTRIRNRAEVKENSIEYRVTNAPVVPEFVDGTYDAIEIVPVDDLLAGTKALSVEWDNGIKSDEFYVAWYLYRGDKKMDDLNIVTYKISNAYSSVFNPADIFHAPVFEKAGEDIEGFYYAVVKNVLNGVESAYSAGPVDAEGKLDPNKMFNVTGS
jgi:hypothetical protein